MDTNPETIDFGSGYLQSRVCQQNQDRIITHRELDDFSKELRVTGTTLQSRTVNETDSQSSTGTRRDWVTTSSIFGNWTDTDAEKNHSAWLPAASNQTASFSQKQTYKFAQTRTEQKREVDNVTSDIRNNGALITHNRDDNREYNRNVTVSATAFANKNAPAFLYLMVTVLPATVDVGSSYTQNRLCQQDMSRNWSYTSGGSIHSRVEGKTVAAPQSQGAVGTKNIIVGTSYGSW